MKKPGGPRSQPCPSTLVVNLARPRNSASSYQFDFRLRCSDDKQRGHAVGQAPVRSRQGEIRGALSRGVVVRILHILRLWSYLVDLMLVTVASKE